MSSSTADATARDGDPGSLPAADRRCIRTNSAAEAVTLPEQYEDSRDVVAFSRRAVLQATMSRF